MRGLLFFTSGPPLLAAPQHPAPWGHPRRDQHTRCLQAPQFPAPHEHPQARTSGIPAPEPARNRLQPASDRRNGTTLPGHPLLSLKARGQLQRSLPQLRRPRCWWNCTGRALVCDAAAALAGFTPRCDAGVQICAVSRTRCLMNRRQWGFSSSSPCVQTCARSLKVCVISPIKLK